MEEQKTCCGEKTEKKTTGFWSGLMYGLIPHTGCIAFIVFTILGVTTATAFFRPLLMNRWFFHFLIGLSFVFATISAVIYLRKHEMLSLEGIKQKKKYLSILYGTSIGINLVLFLFIFPIAANITTASPTGAAVADSLSDITLKVDIPCPGHAPLISEELKTINGVQSIKFRFPDYFDVSYDPVITNNQKILKLEVFNTYSAQLIGEDQVQQQVQAPMGCGRCGGCSGACGGTCGG